MATGNVSIRFSVQDQEVVRAALEKLGKDGEAALRKLDTASKQPAGGLKALSGFMDDLKSRAAGLAVPLGPVGSGLIALGPAGLAAAAGLGAALKVIDLLGSEAQRMGAFALQMRNVQEQTELTGAEFQGLTQKAGDFGGTADNVAAIMGRFASSLALLKQASGPLYEDLNKINPQLALQVSSAKTVAEAWNLIAQAYRNADREQQNLIAKAVGGKGNIITAGGLLGETGKAGGLSGVVSQMNDLDRITEAQIEHWATMKVKIDDALTNAKNNIASIFTTDVLNAQMRFAENFLELSRTAKDFTISDGLRLLLDPVGIQQKLFGGSIGDLLLGKKQPNVQLPNIDPFGKFSDFAGVGAPPSPAVIAAQATALVSALGSAAGATERFNAQYKKLQADLDAGVFGAKGSAEAQANFDRAVGGLKQDFGTQAINARVGALGELASVSDLVKQRQDAINKAQQQGAGLSQPQIAAIINLTRANKEWADMNARAASGVFDLQSASKAAGDVLQSWIDKKLIDPSNPEQYAAAVTVLNKQLQETARSAAIAASPLEKLTALSIDAGDLGKNLDKLGVEMSQSMGQAFTDIVTGSKSASEAFKSLERAVITAIINMIAQMLVVQPIAVALRAIFSSFLPGGGGGGSTQNAGGSGYWFASDQGTPYGGGVSSDVHVTVVEGGGGDKTSAKTRQGPRGETIIEVLTKATQGMVAGGQLDSSMGTRYGARAVPVLRG